jgi:hypothetical protein
MSLCVTKLPYIPPPASPWLNELSLDYYETNPRFTRAFTDEARVRDALHPVPEGALAMDGGTEDAWHVER